jgi:hypothetical protein
MTDIADATTLLAFNIGAGAQCELEFSYIFDISTNSFFDTAIHAFFTHLFNEMYSIGRDCTPSRSSAFAEFIGREELDSSIVGHTGDGLDIGRTLAHIKFHSKTICRQIVKCNKDITMKICVHGFGKDDQTDSKVYPIQYLSLRQNITALTGYGRVVVMVDCQNKPATTTTLPDGTSPIDIFSMEATLNAKEFLTVDTLKCDWKSHLMTWHRDIGPCTLHLRPLASMNYRHLRMTPPITSRLLPLVSYGIIDLAMFTIVNCTSSTTRGWHPKNLHVIVYRYLSNLCHV